MKYGDVWSACEHVICTDIRQSRKSAHQIAAFRSQSITLQLLGRPETCLVIGCLVVDCIMSSIKSHTHSLHNREVVLSGTEKGWILRHLNYKSKGSEKPFEGLTCWLKNARSFCLIMILYLRSFCLPRFNWELVFLSSSQYRPFLRKDKQQFLSPIFLVKQKRLPELLFSQICSNWKIVFKYYFGKNRFQTRKRGTIATIGRWPSRSRQSENRGDSLPSTPAGWSGQQKYTLSDRRAD